jgi:hypothetical protein
MGSNVRVEIEQKPLMPVTGIAVDHKMTSYKEECYQCIRRGANNIIFRVMAVTPPAEKVLDEPLQSALAHQLAGKKVFDLPKFFEHPTINAHTFYRNVQREAIMAEYWIEDDELVREKLSLVDAVVTEQYIHKEYSYTPRAEQHVKIISTILKRRRHLLRQMETNYLRHVFSVDGISAQLLYGALQIFNYTCRKAALNNKVPFVSTLDRDNGEKVFAVSRGGGRYGHPFRDPSAFLNMTILAHFLRHQKVLLSEENLLAMLPKHVST